MHATIIIDLGFGDAGKGLLTDFLARQLGAGLVVRYNGGAQAGHNVTTPDGRQHTFSQFGSGTFLPGVKTFLSRQVVIHPAALLVEGDILAGKGVGDVFARIRVSEEALVITPFHQAANHLRELGRGPDRHGSCGVGVGEAVEDDLSNPADSVRAGDLANPALLRRKLGFICERKRSQLRELYRGQPPGAALAREWEIFERKDVIEAWIAQIGRINALGLVATDSLLAGWLGQTEEVIFEGAQGVLLDGEAGFHPYTTWSNCTGANAAGILAEMAPEAHVSQIGVLRTYAVRHGPGPLPTETDGLRAAISEHNQTNEWQGRVRYGWFDAVLARYALAVTGRLDALAVTHLDVLARLAGWKYCPGYLEMPGLAQTSARADLRDGILKNFSLPGGLSLAQRAGFTRALAEAAPLLETCAAEEGGVIQKIEGLLGQAVGLVSSGPRAGDVKMLAFPR